MGEFDSVWATPYARSLPGTGTATLTQRLLVLMALLLVTGCTHDISFTVPQLAPTLAGKGNIAICTINDYRAAGKPELFVYSNPPHTWIYHPDHPAPDTMRNLLRESVRRLGYA